MTEYLERLPLSLGEPSDEYDCGDGARLFIFRNKNEEDYENSCRRLSDGGFSLFDSNNICGCLHSHFRNESGSVFIYYVPCESTLRVIYDPYTALYCKTPAPGNTAVLWQKEIDHSLIDCGMCYAVKSASGHFFMIDSAHFYSVTENDRIYDFLRANTPEGEKIIIDGWFFSHGHTDHIAKFTDFLQYNMQNVEIRAIYCNIIPTDHRDSHFWDPADRRFSDNFTAAVKASGIPVVKLHTGDRFFVDNLEFEVLCTHEDVWPESFSDYNNSSTVIRMTVGDTKVLFPGDASDKESAILESRYGSYLKSDIVQVSHHGHFGCSTEFYRLVDARVAMFPVTTIKYREEYARIEADRVAEKLADYAPIASEGTVEINLPYDGKLKVYPDDSFEDFDGVFNLWCYTYTDEYKKELYGEYLSRGGKPIEKYEKL